MRLSEDLLTCTRLNSGGGIIVNKCEECGGSGWHWEMDYDDYEPQRYRCKTCQAFRSDLKAVVIWGVIFAFMVWLTLHHMAKDFERVERLHPAAFCPKGD